MPLNKGEDDRQTDRQTDSLPPLQFPVSIQKTELNISPFMINNLCVPLNKSLLVGEKKTIYVICC